MTDQPTTITEAPASTEAGQVAPEARPASLPAQTAATAGRRADLRQTEEQVPSNTPTSRSGRQSRSTPSWRTTSRPPPRNWGSPSRRRRSSPTRAQAHRVGAVAAGWRCWRRRATSGPARRKPIRSSAAMRSRRTRHGSQGARHLRHARTAAQRVWPGKSPELSGFLSVWQQ